MKTKNKAIKIIFLLVIMTSLFLITGCANKADSQNEKILLKVLELEEIAVNKVEIKKDTILVSIEASKADEYDTQIINWWGTIFGVSCMLKGDYLIVVIENTVNKEPYTYISTNVYTIRDFNEDKISDVAFWDETLITENEPSTKEVIQASGLPIDTLTDDVKTKVPLTITQIIIYVSILIVIVLVIIIGNAIIKKRKKKNKKVVEEKNSPHKEHKETLKKEKKSKEHIKKISEKIKNSTKKIKEKTKEKTKSFRERMIREPER